MAPLGPTPVQTAAAREPIKVPWDRSEEVANWLRHRFAYEPAWIPEELQAMARPLGYVLAYWWNAPAVKALGIRPVQVEIYPGEFQTVWTIEPEAPESAPIPGGGTAGRGGREMTVDDELHRLFLAWLEASDAAWDAFAEVERGGDSSPAYEAKFRRSEAMNELRAALESRGFDGVTGWWAEGRRPK